MRKIYEVIRNLREDYDFKQKDVADHLNMSRTTYNHYELGHSSFTAEMIIELSKLFNTTPNVLLNFESPSEVIDTDLIRLCRLIEEENIDVNALIELINLCNNLHVSEEDE